MLHLIAVGCPLAMLDHRTHRSGISLTRIVRISVVKAFPVIDLMHPAVVCAAESFAIFVPCPTGNGVRITVLLAVVHVGPAMVPEVAFRTYHAVVEATPLPGLFCLVLPISERRRFVELLRERAARTGD